MEKLSNPQTTIDVIRRHRFDFQKKFGQNFLIDPHVLDKIIAAAEITEDRAGHRYDDAVSRRGRA